MFVEYEKYMQNFDTARSMASLLEGSHWCVTGLYISVVLWKLDALISESMQLMLQYDSSTIILQL